MATIKAYTNLEQSKKMAEILPIESADMYYWCGEDLRIGGHRAMDIDYDIPCWSLAALLNSLPITCDDGRHCLALINSNPAGTIEWLCCYEDCNVNMMHESYASNQVDACYEMILKLHDNSLL